jgi:release factor glutamine methyltransferase
MQPNVTFKFEVFPQVYPPSDDSFLLAEHLSVGKGERVLDMGTGCGIQGIVASKQGGEVLACDISERAVECASYNARLNRGDMKVVRSDLFENIEGNFDLIAFNPPYLISEPSEPEDELKKAWDGGRDGREVMDRFISEVGDYLDEGGRVILLQSSINGLEKTVSTFRNLGFDTRVVAEKNFFFERLYLLEGLR